MIRDLEQGASMNVYDQSKDHFPLLIFKMNLRIRLISRSLASPRIRIVREYDYRVDSLHLECRPSH